MNVYKIFSIEIKYEVRSNAHKVEKISFLDNKICIRLSTYYPEKNLQDTENSNDVHKELSKYKVNNNISFDLKNLFQKLINN